MELQILPRRFYELLEVKFFPGILEEFYTGALGLLSSLTLKY